MPERVKQWRKTAQRGLLIASYKRLKKDRAITDRAITPAVEAVCVPEHVASPGSLQAKQVHHFHAQLSLGHSCYRKKKKKSMFMCTESLQSCLTLRNPADCGLPGFSVREGTLQARILECIGQYWLQYLSRALYFLLP